MTATVLTREYGLENWTAPNGRVFEIRPWKINPSLMKIEYGDSKGGSIPDALQGMFTKRTEAERHLRNFLKEFWDMSDAQAAKKK